jgi:hypothetical protein
VTLGAFSPLPLRLSDHKDGLSARQHARICADLVAMVRSAPLAIIRVSLDTGDVLASLAQFGFTAPTVVVNATGHITVTWPRSHADQFDAAAAMNLTSARASSHSATAVACTTEIAAPFEVDVHSRLMATGAYTGGEATLVVH